MNQKTESAIVGALESVTQALTTVVALTLQAKRLPTSVDRLTSANDGTAGAPRFVDQGDGTVIDTTTRLQWSKATLTPKCISQHDALKLCAGLSLGGHSDWRLPTRAELLSLVDETRHDPAIDVTAFPDTKSDWYWTGTVAAWSSSRAWFVGFGHGSANYSSRDGSGGLVRAVRSLPPGQ